MKVYAAKHCPCIYESAYATLSLHKTESGANKAKNSYKYKATCKARENAEWRIKNEKTDFGPLKKEDVVEGMIQESLSFEDWSVEEIEILE